MIRYVDAFAGVGGFSQAVKSVTDDSRCVAMIEYDEKARKTFFDNNDADTIFEDITKINLEEIPEHELLLGGFPCFGKGSLVTTRDGLKQIEEVSSEDFVITHKNRFKKVVVPMKKVSNHYNSVKIQGSHELIVTDEHPFYVRKLIGRKWNNDIKKYDKVFLKPEWVECKDLNKDHYVGVPVNKNSVNPDFNQSESFWFMIGRYLADGYSSTESRQERGNGKTRRTYKTIITCGHHDEKIVEQIICNAEYSATKVKERTSFKFIISDKDLWYFVQDFGRGADNKRLPGYVFDMPIELIKNLIDGYVSGDGFKVGDHQYGFSTISKYLAYGFSQLIQKVYRTQSTICLCKVPDKKIIEGRVVNQNNFYRVVFSKERPKNCSYYVIDDIIWTPFKSMTRHEENIDVYNFEVEDDNSYAVNNLIVHNCQSYSSNNKNYRANNKTVVESDERRNLINYLIGILKIRKPKYFVFENVSTIKEIKDVCGETTVFEKIAKDLEECGYNVNTQVLNSSDFGIPQQRKRMFFVGIRNDINQEFIFPVGDKKGSMVKDILEKDVAEEFFLKNAWKNRFCYKLTTDRKSKHLITRLEALEEAYNSGRWKVLNEPTFKISPIAIITGDTPSNIARQADKLYNIYGYCPTLLTFATPSFNAEEGWRNLTPRECFLLQGFPADYIIPTSKNVAYKQAGNAVTVTVVKEILRNLIGGNND